MTAQVSCSLVRSLVITCWGPPLGRCYWSISVNKLLLGVFHLQHLGILGLSTAWLYNFSHHPNAESNNCFIIHPKYLHVHQKILTGLDLSQVAVFMTDLVLSSSGGYSQIHFFCSQTRLQNTSVFFPTHLFQQIVTSS